MRFVPQILALWLAALPMLLALPCRSFAAYPEAVAAEHGIVSTTQHLASEVGADILRQGGNAIDAAVAVGYALAVVDPCCGNIGGGGFMTVHLANGQDAFLDFREHAPLAATPEMYQDKSGKVIPELSRQGYTSVGVPGTVLGLETALKQWGSLPRRKLLAPAIALAEKGFILSQGDVDVLAEGSQLSKDPAAAAIFLSKGGAPFRAGDRLIQHDLARTLRLIAQEGSEAFYRGTIAAAILRASSLHRGILAQADFEHYAVRNLAPVTCSYRGYTITSAPPPSSGGTTLCQTLNILEGYPLAEWGYHSAKSLHVIIEALRFAFADRNAALGDPAFVQNPVAHLTDKAYAASLRAKIDLTRAGHSDMAAPVDTQHEKKQTTNYSIVDGAGNAVDVTYTLNGAFGAQIVAGDTGILLNDEMDDFSAKAGTPNMFGLVASSNANAIAPGKTPLSSMTPTIVSKDGKTIMVVGAQGGPTIITTVLQAIVNVIDYKMTIRAAIDAGRIHHQWLPDRIMVEPLALSPDTQKILEDAGYHLFERNGWGIATGILVGSPALGQSYPDARMKFFGGNDDRRARGSVAGY